MQRCVPHRSLTRRIEYALFLCLIVQVWNLAQDPTHYAGITAVMRLRENLREYVWQLSAETAATGMPIVRPMVLQFPDDPVCATPAVEGQFMLGPDWLVTPVTAYGASNWT